MTETSAIQSGHTIDLNGVEVVIYARQGFRPGAGIKWGWVAPGLDYASEGTFAAAELAIADLYRTHNTGCGTCGEPATMTASTGPACTTHYDDMAG